MAYIQFGFTWWGERWLDSLTHIDFSNRLPRGMRYARNGSVSSINITAGKIHAKVEGTRARPYTIEIKPRLFTAAEKKKLTDLVCSSPYYLSQLASGTLPPELEEDAAEKGIQLFPRSWKDLPMGCSCPDWAVPCKHIAAVIYIVANEIDKNPFMVFTMRGLDLFSEAKKLFSEEKKGPRNVNIIDAVEEIPSVESIVKGIELTSQPAADDAPYLETLEETFFSTLEKIDLTSVPPLHKAASSILTDHPLFYPEKDFKQILLTAMTKLSKQVERYSRTLEISEEPMGTAYTKLSLTLKPGTLQLSGKLNSQKKGVEPLVFSSEDALPLLRYLENLPAENLRAYHPVTALLLILYNYSLQLIIQQAAVPDIIKSNTTTGVIRWIPALFVSEIKEITQLFTEAVELYEAGVSSLMSLSKQAVKPEEVVLFLISFFVRGFISNYGSANLLSSDHPVDRLFFQGIPYKPSKFEEQENIRTIFLWLSRFLLKPLTLQPIIHLEAFDDEYIFEIRIRDRNSPDLAAVSLSEILSGKNPETLALLRDLSLLGTYLGTVHHFLRSAQPVRVGGEAFISQWFAALPVLKILGIQTVVPKALREVFVPALSLKVGVSSGSSEGVVSYMSLSDMLTYDWRISIGDERIAPEEFLALKQQYGDFIRYKDLFLEVSEKDLAALIKSIEHPPKPGPMELLKTCLTGTFDGIPGEIDEETEKLFHQLLTPDAVPVPENLHAELREYQKRGYEWLCHNHSIGLGSILADDMGLGKTIQLIAFLLQLKNAGTVSAKNPVIIIVPASLMTNWQRELERFAPSLSVSIYHGTDRTLPDSVDVVITTYALVRRDLAVLKEKRWSVSVVDEAQNLKNPGTEQTKAVKGIKAKYAIALTGTPVENRLLDYWSILDFIMKGYLGNRKSFKDTYAIPIERFRDQSTLERFRKITAPVMMRRMKTDKNIISDLPEKIVSNRYLELTSEQRILYSELVEHSESLLEGSEGIKRSGLVFKLMTGLKQICCHPLLFTKQGNSEPSLSCKTDMLLDLLETITEREEKALIFTQYAEMGTLLQEYITEKFSSPCLFLHGGTTRANRDKMIESFQEDPAMRFMVLSIKAGGVGLNLTAANHVIHYDLWWNPAVENQATDRSYRIGQKKDVNVYRLIARGTFEEKIADMIERKEELANITVTEGEQWLTKLSENELKEFITLQESGAE